MLVSWLQFVQFHCLWDVNHSKRKLVDLFQMKIYLPSKTFSAAIECKQLQRRGTILSLRNYVSFLSANSAFVIRKNCEWIMKAIVDYTKFALRVRLEHLIDLSVKILQRATAWPPKVLPWRNQRIQFNVLSEIDADCHLQLADHKIPTVPERNNIINR